MWLVFRLSVPILRDKLFGTCHRAESENGFNRHRKSFRTLSCRLCDERWFQTRFLSAVGMSVYAVREVETRTLRPPRGHLPHDRLLETSSAPTQHPSICSPTLSIKLNNDRSLSDLTRILLNPTLLMNAVWTELAQSDAPFLSTTVAPKHPVELFRHLTHKIGSTSSPPRPKKP